MLTFVKVTYIFQAELNDRALVYMKLVLYVDMLSCVI